MYPLPDREVGYPIYLEGDSARDFTVWLSPGGYSGFVQWMPMESDVSWDGVLYAMMLTATSRVNASWFDGTNGTASATGQLYLGGDGPWATVGAHGYVALRLNRGDGNYNYGWIEITRGSLTIDRMGYQDTLNADAPTKQGDLHVGSRAAGIMIKAPRHLNGRELRPPSYLSAPVSPRFAFGACSSGGPKRPAAGVNCPFSDVTSAA